MDYLRQPLWFNIKKIFRYVRLYGVSRTLAKVRGKCHMAKRYDALPTVTGRDARAHVGIIGCGNFSYTTIAHFLTKRHGAVIRGTMDVDAHRAASLCEAYGAHYYTTDPDTIIRDPRITLIFIASNHASHAEYAIRALEMGKSVHIEKPHAVNEDQLTRLCEAMRASSGKVRLGFPRPSSDFVSRIQDALDTQGGPALLSWFIVGHHLPTTHWYYRTEEGGRVLGNLAHWIDLTYRMVPPAGRYPITITPVRHTKSDHDIVVNYQFGDGTIAPLAFAAKGYASEGVRERFVGAKGDALIFMEDFQRLTITIGDRTSIIRTRHRDQGHRDALMKSYALVADPSSVGEDIWYIWETGELMLKTKEALERNASMTIVSNKFYDRTRDAASRSTATR